MLASPPLYQGLIYPGTRCAYVFMCMCTRLTGRCNAHRKPMEFGPAQSECGWPALHCGSIQCTHKAAALGWLACDVRNCPVSHDESSLCPF